MINYRRPLDEPPARRCGADLGERRKPRGTCRMGERWPDRQMARGGQVPHPAGRRYGTAKAGVNGR